MLQRVLILGATLAVAAPVHAQQAPAAPAGNPPAASSSAEDPSKRQVVAFEMLLRAAIETAGQRLYERAQQAVPGVALSPSGNPIVRGVHIPDVFVFDVQIPEITQTGLSALRMMQNLPRSARPDPVRPVSNGGRVGATSVPDDPMVTSPMLPAPAVGAYDEDVATAEYTQFSREALYNAVLDSAQILQVADTDHLVVVAGPATPTNYLNTSRKLILRVSGADLNLYRAGKVTKDELKQRIEERRF